MMVDRTEFSDRVGNIFLIGQRNMGIVFLPGSPLIKRAGGDSVISSFLFYKIVQWF